ncbi:MAG: hypothetical protein AUI15_16365 [Actinobacteria bacterium 13_2_20CM_2_66_6]|nr:MAG: hypothetical protein AUI15_16365 [Actinobacteria bacterium 13_2_20CM_2_66_6]
MSHADHETGRVRFERAGLRPEQPFGHECEDAFRDIATDVGASVEAAMTVGIERGRDVALVLLQRLAARQEPEMRARMTRVAFRAAHMRMSEVPRLGGGVANRTSFCAMLLAHRALKATRSQLEAMK